MYAILCSGGFPVPEKEGQLRIWAIKVVPTTVGTTVELKLRDDWSGNLNALDTDKNVIAHLKGDGNDTVMVEYEQPLVVRSGLRATTMTNVDNCLVYIS